MNPAESIHQGVETNVLFNRQKDPGQMNNLFNNENFSEIRKELAGLTHEWMSQFGDEGFSNSDFLNMHDRKFWQTNYTDRPIDLLKANK